VKKVLTAVLVVGLLAVAGGAAWLYGPFRNHHDVLQLPGTVEVQDVHLGSKLGGRVLSVSVREGEHVQADQELVRFETPELDAQSEQLKARLQGAEADLLKAQRGPRPEEIAEAQAAWEAADARLLKMQHGWREEERRQAHNEMDAAEAALVLAESEFARIDQLYRTGGGATVSKADWDAARSARDQSRKRFNAAQARNDMLTNGSRPEDIAEATAELARAKAHFELLKHGTREEDKAIAAAQVAEIKGKLQEIEVNRREAVVRAPGPAVVEVLAVRKGDLVPPNQPVLRILRDDDQWVKVFVPETELGKVRLGQQVEVTNDAYPGRRFPGTVIQIAAVSEFTPRNVQSIDERRHQVFAVKVRVDNREGVFKSGMAAEVFIPLAGAP
jgi:multidrug resistance efflux pump